MLVRGLMAEPKAACPAAALAGAAVRGRQRGPLPLGAGLRRIPSGDLGPLSRRPVAASGPGRPSGGAAAVVSADLHLPVAADAELLDGAAVEPAAPGDRRRRGRAAAGLRPACRRDGLSLFVDNYQIDIQQACSGMNSLISVSLIAPVLHPPGARLGPAGLFRPDVPPHPPVGGGRQLPEGHRHRAVDPRLRRGRSARGCCTNRPGCCPSPPRRSWSSRSTRWSGRASPGRRPMSGKPDPAPHSAGLLRRQAAAGAGLAVLAGLAALATPRAGRTPSPPSR